MLSLMLGCGVVSRLVSGLICDRIGGCARCCSAPCCRGWRCCCSCPSTRLVSLYVISALFGLFQGGIVPSYAIIVREHFPPAEAGHPRGHRADGHLLGMALGGWMSGRIFDLTGSYDGAPSSTASPGTCSMWWRK
jgi:MFS family permease